MNKYINNKEFLKLLTEYQAQPEPKPKIPEAIGRMFLLIAQNILNRPHCINLTKDRKDEIVSRVVYYMCLYINRYDTTIKTSPFAYFTTVAMNQFRQYCNLQKKQLERFINLSFIENMDNEFEIEQGYNNEY